MSPRNDPASILARLAAASEPAPLDDAKAQSLVDGALDRALAPERPRRRSFGWAIALAAAAVVLLAFGAGAWIARDRAPAPIADPYPSRFSLPTGDRLAATAGARFELAELGAHRRIRVSRGELVFDVRPLGEGTSFEVATPHLRARVVGTVFGVQADERGSVVRVYEGRVEVSIDGEVRSIGAGESIASGATDRSSDAMAALGRELAAERTVAREPHARVTPAPLEAVEDAPPIAPIALEVPRPAPVHREPPPIAPVVEQATPDGARAWIASGDPQRALEAAQRALAAGPSSRWSLVEGDAERALHRFADAAASYERAAEDPSVREQAGYLAASVRAQNLDDVSGALEVLARTGCADAGSPLAERALALRASLLTRSGEREQAVQTAREYLERFPNGPRRDAMQALAAE